MIKVKLLFIGIFIWNLGSVYGQSCGTPMPTNVNAYSQPELEKTYNYGENICIDVQFHVVRNSDGSLAFTPESENAMLNELNEFFNPHQIFFNSVGTNFIDNTNYTIVSESEAEQLVTIDNNPNALNYYVVQELWNVGSGFVTGTAVSIPSSIYIKTRAKNECGCSSWKGKWFSVQTPPSGCVDCPTDGGIIHY